MDTLRTRPAAPVALLVTAIVVLALNLRGPIVAVSAVVDPIRADLGIDAATVGLLTSIPVLCFAVATPLASWLLGRLGPGSGLMIALGLLLGGTVLRSVDGLSSAIAGTALIGLGITLGNVGIPLVIGRDLPERAASAMATYTAAMNVGSMGVLTMTAPLAAAVGWRIALASWGLLAIAAVVVWWRVARRELWVVGEARVHDLDGGEASGAVGVTGEPADDGAEPAARAWWRRPVVWGLAGGFACQAFSYYGITAWLPTLLADELGMSPAGAAASASIFQIAAVAGAFGVPLLQRAFGGSRPVAVVVSAAWIAFPLGMLVAPSGWVVWCALAGAAQGAGFTVIFTAVVRKARSLAENRKTSSLIQSGGYLVAAAAPATLGGVYSLTGGWDAPLVLVLVALGVFGVLITVAAG